MWISCWPRIRCIDWKSGWLAIGKTDLEKDADEANAKRLITTWGGFQEDYAARVLERVDKGLLYSPV